MDDDDDAEEGEPAVMVQRIKTSGADEGIGPRGSVMVAEGDPRRDRSHRVALELLSTERTYVDVLHLLDQVRCGPLSSERWKEVKVA